MTNAILQQVVNHDYTGRHTETNVQAPKTLTQHVTALNTLRWMNEYCGSNGGSTLFLLLRPE